MKPFSFNQCACIFLNKTKPTIYFKGAPEKILNMCKNVVIGEQVFPLDVDLKHRITQDYLHLASMGERVLGKNIL